MSSITFHTLLISGDISEPHNDDAMGDLLGNPGLSDEIADVPRDRLQRAAKYEGRMNLEGRTFRPGPQEDGFLYILGAAVCAYIRAVGGCTSCEQRLSKPPPPNSFVYERKYTEDSKLFFPSDSLLQYMCAVDAMIQRYIHTRAHQQRVIDLTLNEIAVQFPPPAHLRCDAHADVFKNILLKRWIATSLRLFVIEKSEKIARERLARRKRKKFMKLNVALPSKRQRIM